MAGTFTPSQQSSGAAGWRSPLLPYRLLFLAGLALGTVPAAGCVTTLPSLCLAEKPPVGSPCQLATTWDQGLRETFNLCEGGAPVRGLKGHLFLLDADCKMVSGDGSVIVDLYDDRPLAAGGQPVALEQWRFPPAVLKLLLRRDGFGWNYTLFLPWQKTYLPEITQIHVRVCYVQVNGTPMYAKSDTINLGDPNGPAAQGFAKAGASRAPAASNAAAAAAARPGSWVPAAPQQPPPLVQAAAQYVPQPQRQPATQGAMPSSYPSDMPPPLAIPLRRGVPPLTQASATAGVPAAGPTLPPQAVVPTYVPLPTAPAAPATEAGWAGKAK